MNYTPLFHIIAYIIFSLMLVKLACQRELIIIAMKKIKELKELNDKYIK